MLLCLFEILDPVYQQLKRKSEVADYEAESIDRAAGPRFTEVVNSPHQTPVSVKGGKGSKSRLTKCSRSGPQTPMSNFGKLYIVDARPLGFELKILYIKYLLRFLFLSEESEPPLLKKLHHWFIRKNFKFFHSFFHKANTLMRECLSFRFTFYKQSYSSWSMPL